VIWRSARALQVGVRPQMRLTFDSTEEAVACAKVLTGLDGSRTWSQLIEHDSMLHSLAMRGLLLDAAAHTGPVRATARERATAETAALGLRRAHPSAAAQVMRTRASRSVVVRGDERLGTAIASLLAASGVGRVILLPESAAARHDLVADYDLIPGGPLPDETGTSRLAAARAAVDRASIIDAAADVSATTSLVIVARDCTTGAAWVDPESCDDLVGAAVAHLVTAVAALGGRVGPLVLPGTTACQRCVALALVDGDPDWPMVAAHLVRPRRRTVPPVAALAVAMVAAITVDHALRFLDDGSCLSGVLDIEGSEITAVDAALHHRCGCAWALEDPRAS
jgi:hypothetical protein